MIPAYRSRSIAPRSRRSAAEVDQLLIVVRRLLDQQSGRISIRHLFYLVVAGGASVRLRARTTTSPITRTAHLGWNGWRRV
jgi:hypothetical protein